MRPMHVSTSGVSVSQVVPFDYLRNGFSVGIGCVVTGAVTYTVQHTFDDVQASTWTPASGNWYAHDDTALVNATANANGNYAFPITAARINQTAGAGSVAATFIQSGLLGA